MEQEQEIEKPVGHLEVAAVEATALEVMERAQIDTQIATAHRFPRSLAVFMKKATDMVSIDKETAASCLYSRPVGKTDGRMKYAQGESIRLAEIVAASFGNLRVGAIITEMTPRYVKAVGMAHDLEANYGFKAEVVESTVKSNGAPYSERQRLVTAKAAQSKAIRDVIFRVVPKSLCKPIANVAKEIALGAGETLEHRRKRVMEWIGSVGIEPERVFAAMDVKGIEDLTQDHLIILWGVRTAIKDGDVTADEAFPRPETAAEPQQAGTAGLKARLNDSGPSTGEEKASEAKDPTPIQEASRQAIANLRTSEEARAAEEAKKLEAEVDQAAKEITEQPE